jgi:hypothetical protein
LSQIRLKPKSTGYPANTQIGVVQRILAESTFDEIHTILSGDMQWSHVPDMIKREIVGETFSVDSYADIPEVQKSIIDAKALVASGAFEKKPDESDQQFQDRFKEKTGIPTTDVEALALEARKS